MQKQFRPEIPKDLWKGLDRFATAHYITRTAAVNVLLKKALVEGKWMTISKDLGFPTVYKTIDREVKI